jgi:hypothetical protein
MNIKLSSRDVMEKEYDPKGFNPDSVTPFQKNFSATTMAKELFYQGYNTPEAIKEQFKIRNLDVDAEVKKIIKAVIEKLSVVDPPIEPSK